MDGRIHSVFFRYYGTRHIECCGGIKDYKVYDGINSTYIKFIPKVNKPKNFRYFRPISLFNMIYKVIEKVIALQLKPIMSDMVTEEQFIFLHNQKIHDGVSLAQEAIHTIKK